MRDDPAGHYAALGVEPSAEPAAIAAAFRAAARRLHPDVPRTGNVAAFMRLREAYDVLGHPERRSAYDRDGLTESWVEYDESDGQEYPSSPGSASHDIPAAAWTRPAGLALGLWAGGAAVALTALVIGFRGVDRPAPSPLPVPPRAGQTLAAAPARPPPEVTSGLGELAGAGYVLPGVDAAILWRRDSVDGRFTPIGEIPAFVPVAIRAIVAEHGMAEVRTPDGRDGFVYASRIAPGDAAAAERARCIDKAGAPPVNNEILARQGSGASRVVVENRREQPAVVKLRDLAGVSAANVFIAPNGVVAIDHLPAGAYRPEFAFGELWSRGCGRFVAGMRAQHFAVPDRPDETGATPRRYTVPTADAIDEADDVFNRD